ncbi:MAG TPA: FecR family protein [Lacipirellulaceae bacterium]|nr:FecR family protein [Lacipirellulaceae bacterium]
MTGTFRNDELVRLVGAMCDGTISASDAEQLDSLITSDHEARQFYNNYMFLHAELYSQHASLEAVEKDFGSRISDYGLTIADSAAFNLKSEIRNPKWTRWFAMAAAFIGVAAVSSWLTYSLTSRTAIRGAEIAKANGNRSGNYVARITATRNSLWAGDDKSLGFGSRLTSGERLELATGLVEITFDDGAVVVLEGPATFDVDSPGRAALHEGRLAATVPKGARGFQVTTARMNVVDLGTEFGVMAEKEGTAEVHVFKGLVKAQLLDEHGHQLRTMELNTAQAARIEPTSSFVARIPARDDEFVRTLSVAAGPHDGLLAYDGFNYPAGPLDEQNGGFGWAGPWFSVEADSKATSSSNGVKTGNLDYEGLTPVGNHAVQTAQQNRIRRSLGTSLGGVFDAAGLVENQDGVRLIGRDGASIYMSFLQRVSKINDVFYGFELNRGDGNGNRVLCIGSGVDGTGYGVTSNFNVYGQRNFPSLGKENTDVNFFVVKIEFGAGNRDRVEVYRNPASLVDESACKPDAELVGNFAFDRISLGNFHGTKIHEIDEIRMGTTFRAVTGRRGRGPDRLAPQVAWSKEKGARNSELRRRHFTRFDL